MDGWFGSMTVWGCMHEDGWVGGCIYVDVWMMLYGCMRIGVVMYDDKCMDEDAMMYG